MNLHRSPKAAKLIALTLAAVVVAGCGAMSPTSAPRPADSAIDSTAEAGKKSFSIVLDGDFILDYEVETVISAIDGKSCYAFITGNLTNNSRRRLARESVLDFKVMHKNKMLFRDIPNLLADLPPGGRATFSMVESPVHKKPCPSYDRVDVSLRKVFQN